ncbi:urease subunit beta [Micromonospora sp. NPDC048986]|uniref:urease subunit beta n=1 Tax=Micromonospora sp. NPDC048986 TaxID=3155644 RepID=UPI0034107E90
MIPGEILPAADPVEINVGRPVTTVLVVNTADRPVQVGSHYHFAEANPALSFDRGAAWGQRLAVPAGTSVRFEPGINRSVDLVPLGGARVVPGLRAESAGPLDPPPHEVTADGSPR